MAVNLGTIDPQTLYAAKFTEMIAKLNRDVTSIRGFTRETLSALIVDIESHDWRRSFNKANKIPPEHPRSSTTDDVECFFSILRDMVGKDFTLKEVCNVYIMDKPMYFIL